MVRLAVRVGTVLSVLIAAGFGCICAAAAQSSPPLIGVLTPGITLDPALAGMREGMAKLGFKEGKDFKLLVEDSKGDPQNFAALAAKIIEAKPDLIFTIATPPTVAAKKATQTIPIVFTVVGDPIEAGVAAAYASSGNNLTGVTPYTSPLSGKRLELLKEILPGVKRVFAVVSPKETVSTASLRFLEEAAKKVRVQVIRRDVTSVEEIEKVLVEQWAGQVDAVFHVPSVLVGSNVDRVIAKTIREKLPIIVHDDALMKKGALVSYGTDYHSLGVQAAKLVVKVLKGVKPADLPVETPDRLFLTINLSTAKAIGLKIPRKILERADHLLE
jgi:putative ABC transport system substrate-binding protein